MVYAPDFSQYAFSPFLLTNSRSLLVYGAEFERANATGRTTKLEESYEFRIANLSTPDKEE